MKLENYQINETPGGAELCCGMCQQPMVYDAWDPEYHSCSKCGEVLLREFAFQDPPTKGVNFGFARPNGYAIEQAKQLLEPNDVTKKVWCIVEGSDSQFRLYMLE